jgi:hypothetical protein
MAKTVEVKAEGESERPISELSKDISKLADELTKHSGFKSPRSHGLARFPRGWIRPKNTRKWPYLKQAEADTLACMHQLHDVYHWHLRAWDLSFAAGNAFLWQAELVLHMIIEHVAVGYCHGPLATKAVKFDGAISLLKNRKVIDAELAQELHLLRQERNKVHLSKMGPIRSTPRGYSMYAKAIKALNALHDAIDAHRLASPTV